MMYTRVGKVTRSDAFQQCDELSTPLLTAKHGTDEHTGTAWEARTASATFLQG